MSGFLITMGAYCDGSHTWMSLLEADSEILDPIVFTLNCRSEMIMLLPPITGTDSVLAALSSLWLSYPIDEVRMYVLSSLATRLQPCTMNLLLTGQWGRQARIMPSMWSPHCFSFRNEMLPLCKCRYAWISAKATVIQSNRRLTSNRWFRSLYLTCYPGITFWWHILRFVKHMISAYREFSCGTNSLFCKLCHRRTLLSKVLGTSKCPM